MKKTVLLLVFCIMHFGLLLGQTNKGNVLIGLSTAFNLAGSGDNGAGIGYTFSEFKNNDEYPGDYRESESFQFNFSPKAGYFIAKNFAIGLLSNYGYSKTHYDGKSSSITNRQYNIGPFLRYYIPTKKVLPFLELGSSFGKNYRKTAYPDLNMESKASSRKTVYSAGIGMAIPIGDKVTFDLLIGYENLVYKQVENNDSNARFVSHSIGLDLGFAVFLGKSE